MLLPHRSWFVVIAVSMALASAACRPKPAEKPGAGSAEGTGKGAREGSGSHRAAEGGKQAKQEKPPPRPTIPQVSLSEADLADCVVKVGDQLPNAKLPDVEDKMHVVSSLGGRKLTVVCFWSLGESRRSSLVAAQGLKDLTREIVEPFAEKGVRLIGIDVGDPAEAVKQQLSAAGVAFPILLDQSGEYMAQVAKVPKDRRNPRPYLLDADGKILWFDVELSRDSLRELVQGIRVALGEL